MSLWTPSANPSVALAHRLWGWLAAPLLLPGLACSPRVGADTYSNAVGFLRVRVPAGGTAAVADPFESASEPLDPASLPGKIGAAATPGDWIWSPQTRIPSDLSHGRNHADQLFFIVNQ